MKALVLSLLFVMPAFAAGHPLQTAKVISQNVGAYNGGSIATASASGTANYASGTAIGVPILRAVNTIVLETPERRLTLVEITGRNYLLLTVNEPVSFYIDGNRAYIEDGKHKKHKFFVTRMEDTTQEK
jgi:hypothetical protein